MTRVTGGLVAIAAILMAEVAPASAADTTPLPDGFHSATTSTRPGLYVHAVAFDGSRDHQEAIQKVSSDCLARGRLLEYSGDVDRPPTTQYWLYRSNGETIVFESRRTLRIDADRCQVTAVEERKVTRDAAKPGQWPPLFHGGRGCSRYKKNCFTSQKFGVRQRCQAIGNSFQVSRDCVSVDRGPSRGLLLESVYESDDMAGHGFQVRALMSNATLDASLFDPSQKW